MREIGRRIIKQVKKGDYHAFEKLVEHYHQSVYQICYLIIGNNKIAEDLAKDIFLHVYYHINDWQESPKKFSLWLFQITVSFVREQLSKGERTGMTECPALDKENNIPFILLHVALKERLALTLKASSHLSIQEISEVLEIPNSDTPTYIWRGRETIRERISQ